MFLLLQFFSMLGRLFELLHWMMWVAIVLVPIWMMEKAILAAAAAIARTDPDFEAAEKLTARGG